MNQLSSDMAESYPVPVRRPRKGFPRKLTQLENPHPTVLERSTCPIAMIGIKRVDFILQTLTDSKITITSIRAVIKLYIAAEGGDGTASHSTLAALMGMTSAAITRVADTIENLGYAVRSTNTSDRRSTLIQLTPLGVEIAEWLGNEIHQEESRIQTPALYPLPPFPDGMAHLGSVSSEISTSSATGATPRTTSACSG